jgi:RHS repeat-associated protein
MRVFNDWRGDTAVVEVFNRDYQSQLPRSATGQAGNLSWVRVSEQQNDAAGRVLQSRSYRGPLYGTSAALNLNNYEQTSYSYWRNTDTGDRGVTMTSPGGAVTLRMDGYDEPISIIGMGMHRKFSSSAIEQRQTVQERVAGSNTFITKTALFAGGAVKQVNSSTGAQVNYTYDIRGLPTQMQERMNGAIRTTASMVYDNLGRALSSTLLTPQGSGIAPFKVMEVGYNQFSLPAWTKNHRGEQTSYQYDELGRLIDVQFGGEGVSYKYAPHRNWIEEETRRIGSDAYRVTYSYDLRGRQVKASELGRGGKVTPRTTETFYNSFGAVEAIKAADGKISQWSSGLDGFTWWSRPYAGVTMRAARTMSADGSELIEIFDSSGRKSEYNVNPLGLLVSSKRLPGSAATTYQYDASRRLIALAKPNGVNATFAYDNQGRFATGTWSRGSEVITRTNTFTDGRLTKRAESNSNGENSFIEYAYDIFGALREEKTTLPGGRVSTVAAHRFYTDSPDNFSVQKYDFAPHKVMFQGARLNESLNISYDNQSRITSLGFGAGGAIGLPTTAATFGYYGSTINEVKLAGDKLRSTVSYDKYGQLEQSLSEWSGKAVDGYQLKRNILGQVTAEGRLFSPSKAWMYDGLDRPFKEKSGVSLQSIVAGTSFDQLTAHQTSTLEFANGGASQLRTKRTTTKGKTNTVETYGINEKGQYTQFRGLSISYDPAGNLLTDESTMRSVEYDVLDRPVRVKDSAGNVVRQYTYGPDKRIQALVSTNSGATTYNLWGGWSLLGDETVSPGNPVPVARVYLQHPQVQDELIAFYQTSNAVTDDGATALESYYVTNRHDGSPSAILNASGQVVERYDHTKDGVLQVYVGNNRTPRSSSSLKQPFGFHGMYFDDVARRYLVRNRTFDPQKGAFDSVDPVDDPANLGELYPFVANDPVNFTDRWGLQGGTAIPGDQGGWWSGFWEGAWEGVVNVGKGIRDIKYTIDDAIGAVIDDEKTNWKSELFKAYTEDQITTGEVAKGIVVAGLTVGIYPFVTTCWDRYTGKIDDAEFSQTMGGFVPGILGIRGVRGARVRVAGGAGAVAVQSARTAGATVVRNVVKAPKLSPRSQPVGFYRGLKKIGKKALWTTLQKSNAYSTSFCIT